MTQFVKHLILALLGKYWSKWCLIWPVRHIIFIITLHPTHTLFILSLGLKQTLQGSPPQGKQVAWGVHSNYVSVSPVWSRPLAIDLHGQHHYNTIHTRPLLQRCFNTPRKGHLASSKLSIICHSLSLWILLIYIWYLSIDYNSSVLSHFGIHQLTIILRSFVWY